MNMISTGAFLPETDASTKQSELVKKLTSAWEKKNSKTARAGGASLMALSLAACGGEDNTPFSAADVSAAEAAATTAALTGADGTVYASVDAAVTSNDTAIADAARAEGVASVDITTDNQAAIDAAVAAVDLTTDNAAAIDAAVAADTAFASLADLVAAYDALVSPVTVALTDDDATGVAPDAPSMSSGNDSITGTDETFDAGDVIVDASTTDADTLVINTATDISATPTVMNVETVSFNATGTFSSGDTTLTVDVSGFAGTNTFNFDSTGDGSLVATLAISNADSGHYVASDDFTTISVAADTDADIVLTIAEDASISTTGAADDLTIHGGGKDVTITSSAATEDLVVDGAVDTSITAASIAGNVTVSGTGDSSVTTAAATGSVTITSAGTIAVDATLAEGAVTLDNTGATAGDDITITDVASATEVNATSVGAISSGGTNMAAAASITYTAVESSVIDADSVTASQTINVNAVDPDGDEITFTVNANSVDELNIGGTSAAEVAIVGADLGTGASAATVTSSNTAGGSILLNDNGNADTRNVESDVTIRIETTFANNTVTIADGATVAFNTEAAMAAAPTFDHVTDATSATSNSMTVTTYDTTATNADTTVNLAGFAVTDVQSLTIALGANGLDTSADITGADLETVTVTGTGDFDLNGNTITGDGTNRVTLDASALEGDVTMVIDNTTAGVASVTTGSGTDAITISNITGATAGASVTMGAGADQVTVTTSGDGATSIMTIDGGTGTDVLYLQTSVDISDSTVNLTSVEVIEFQTDGTISSNLVSGQSLIIDGGADSDITVAVDASTVDLSTLAFTSDLDDADDSVTVDGSANALSQVLTGSSIHDTITGGTASDVITGGAGDDILAGGSGDDTLSGDAGADQFTVSAGRDTITGGTGVDNIIITANSGSIYVTDFDFGGGATNDNITLTTSAAIADAAGNAAAVSTGVNGGAIAVTTIAADTAIGAAATQEVFVVTNGADNVAATLAMTDAAIETLIAAQLADGGTDISANLATGEGYIGLILNDLDGDGTDDSYLMYEHIASGTGAGVTEAAEITLIGIFAGTDAANIANGDLI